MKFTKQAVLGSVLALGLFAQTTIGLAEELQGQLNVTLRGSDSNGALTLEKVADLSGQFNIINNNATIAPLTKKGDIEISDTRATKKPWHLSVEVKQPKERGTSDPLGASAISFNIDTRGRDNLEAFNSNNVLSEEGEEGVATKVLGGQFNQTISEDDISSELTLGDPFNSKAKGVYQSIIIYTLTDDVDSRCQVTFNTDGGSAVESIAVDKYGKITAPENPTKDDFNFLGWYEEGSETSFDFSKPITRNTTLKAKWESYAPITDETPSAGEMIQFAGTEWRILKVADDKALVIKYNALTNAEIGDSGDEVATVPFHDQLNGTDDEKNKYFLSQTDDGYSRSNLKKVIDNYYSSKIAPDYSDYVLDVTVQNPKFSELSGSVEWTAPNDLDNWNAGSESYDFWKENRWPTTHGAGSKQAFALSSSDIIYYGLNNDETNSTLLDFSDSNFNSFWLRSAGRYFDYAGYVAFGDLNYGNYVNDDSVPVRPALWLSLNK